MLVLTRKEGQRVLIGPRLRLTLVRIGGNKVRLGFDGDDDVEIVRAELTLDEEMDEETKPEACLETA